MKIEKIYKPETMEHEIRIKFSDQYLVTECERHPYAHLIDDEQGYGIVEDAVLLSCGLQKKCGKEVTPTYSVMGAGHEGK